MNKQRRQQITQAREKIADAEAALQAAREILEIVRDEEQEAHDSLHENMQNGQQGEKMQEAIGALDEAMSEIDLVDFDAITSQLDTAEL